MTDTLSTTAAAQDERWTWHLNDAELAETTEKIRKLNERAAKRGLSGLVTLDIKRAERMETLPSGYTVTKGYWSVEILGTAPKYAGWSFIATLDFDPEAGLITKTVPNFKGVVDRSGLRANWCDHCKTNRFRRFGYLLENESGARVQVGSSCIKDFLGQDVRPVFHDADAVRDSVCYGGFDDYDVSPLDAIAIAWAAVQEFGFVRASEYDNVPTKVRMEQVIYPRTRPDEAALADRAVGDKLRPLAAKAAEQAKLIRDFILSDEFSGDSEYVQNLKNIVGAERVGRRFFGLLASAPQAWAKAVERDLRRQAEKAEITNEFFGSVKDRIELTVRVKSIRYFDGDFGTTTIYTLVTDDGHPAQWWASNSALGNEVTNHSYLVKATIKGHEEYQGTKYTKLTRVTVLEDHPGEESA